MMIVKLDEVKYMLSVNDVIFDEAENESYRILWLDFPADLGTIDK